MPSTPAPRPRRLGLVLAAAVLASSAPAAGWSQSAPAGAPGPPAVQRGVGARTITGSEVDRLRERTFALLFLFGDDALNEQICDRFLRFYGSSLTDRRPYEKFIYLPVSTNPPVLPGTCREVMRVYDQRASDGLSRHPKLHLDRLQQDRGAILMLIERDGGDLSNAGYVLLTGLAGAAVDGRFRVFDRYAQQDPRCWTSDEIRVQGLVEGTANVLGQVFGGPKCPYH